MRKKREISNLGVMKKRFFVMLFGVLFMGVFLSFLLRVGYGTDPSSFMNSSVANRTGISLGTVMLTINILMFIPEIIWGRHFINLGTICNMTLIGYTADLTTYLTSKILPQSIFTTQPERTITFIIALILFLISAALYMNADLGLAPYDAIPTMISKATKAPFFIVRMLWDFFIILIGVLVGGELTIASVVLAFTLGPTVSYIGKLIKL